MQQLDLFDLAWHVWNIHSVVFQMLQEPSAFSTAVQGLLSAQRQALAARAVAGGEHLCFLGSGRNEEDQYAHMVVASFLQKHTQYISMVTGGYQGNGI